MKAVFNISYTAAEPPKSYTGEMRAEYIAERNFYNLTAGYNYFNYTLNGSKVEKNANAEHYFTREGATGLFDMDGVISEEKKAKIKEQLKDTKSIIWHGFISFDEETSLGFTNQENCIKFMRQTFGGFLERAGFRKSNIVLYCSLHSDTAHRHIHFAFYENEPQRLDKYGDKQYTRKGMIKSEAIDNYLVSANMHLSAHGAEYYTARDGAIAEMNRLRAVKSHTGFVDGRATTAALLLNVEINKLCSALPTTGRLQYNAKELAPVRPQIDRVADMLIRSNAAAFAAHGAALKQLARVKSEVEELAQSGELAYRNGGRMTAEEVVAAMGAGDMRGIKMSPAFVDMSKVDYFERLEADYKARIGNVVLKMCKDAPKDEKYPARRYVCVNDKQAKIAARRGRIYQKDLLKSAQRAMVAVARSDSANYLKTVKQHERDIENESYYGVNAE